MIILFFIASKNKPINVREIEKATAEYAFDNQ